MSKMPSKRGHEPGERRARDRDALGFGTDLCPHRRPLVRGDGREWPSGRREADCSCGRPRLVVEFSPYPGLTTHQD
jgi:hypothetical protein